MLHLPPFFLFDARYWPKRFTDRRFFLFFLPLFSFKKDALPFLSLPACRRLLFPFPFHLPPIPPRNDSSSFIDDVLDRGFFLSLPPPPQKRRRVWSFLFPFFHPLPYICDQLEPRRPRCLHPFSPPSFRDKKRMASVLLPLFLPPVGWCIGSVVEESVIRKALSFLFFFPFLL